MLPILKIDIETDLDKTLTYAWRKWKNYGDVPTQTNWKLFLKTLDGVVGAEYSYDDLSYTTITFESEESKMFFLS